MIPIIVILEGGESFNYFEGRIRKRDSEYSGSMPDFQSPIYLIEQELNGIVGNDSGECQLTVCSFGTDTNKKDWEKREELKQLRDKVLELLHEEASKLCYENTIGCIIPACFQIHIKDIIEKAKGVTPNA